MPAAAKAAPTRSKGSLRRSKSFVLCMLLLIAAFVTLASLSSFSLADLHDAPGSATVEKAQTCVGDRLLIDSATRTLGDNRGEDVIPFMIVPLMLDVYQFQELMCNISVPVRTLVLVQNMEEPVLSAYLSELETLYGWSGRLVVRRHPENVGYGGSVNVGLRLALSLPRDEVPFVFVSNNDVSFSPDILPRLLRDVRRMTAHDAARMDELAAEVSREPSEHTPPDRPLRVLRAPHCNGTLCTSALLPDRIRYAPGDARAKEFARHYSLFTMRENFSAYFLSRLSISTVGLYDENFFPAYFEDIDLKWRMLLLGFRIFDAPYGKMHHAVNLNQKLMLGHTGLAASVPARWFKKVFNLGLPTRYAEQTKWKTGNYLLPAVSWEPFDNRIPLDAWVLDTARNNAIRRYGHEINGERPPSYNTQLFRQAGVERGG